MVLTLRPYTSYCHTSIQCKIILPPPPPPPPTHTHTQWHIHVWIPQLTIILKDNRYTLTFTECLAHGCHAGLWRQVIDRHVPWETCHCLSRGQPSTTRLFQCREMEVIDEWNKLKVVFMSFYTIHHIDSLKNLTGTNTKPLFLSIEFNLTLIRCCLVRSYMYGVGGQHWFK